MPTGRSSFVGVIVLLALGWSACAEPDLRNAPDEVLRRELGLDDGDYVLTVTVTGGGAEAADPELDSVPSGAFVEFVSGDWLVHEVHFDMEGVVEAARAYLERTDQIASPPLLQRGSRFVVSFDGAPPGRYPYLLQGNAEPGRGVIVVTEGVRRGTPRRR